MIRFLQISLILLLVGTTACRKARALGPPKAVPIVADGRLELNLMTFNVRFPNPDDGFNIWENRRDLLVDTIRRSDPDVFGTQEMYESQGDYIAENLPRYRWLGIGREGDHDGVSASAV